MGSETPHFINRSMPTFYNLIMISKIKVVKVMHTSKLLTLKAALGIFERAQEGEAHRLEMAEAIMEILQDTDFLEWMLCAMDDVLDEEDVRFCKILVETMRLLDVFFAESPRMEAFQPRESKELLEMVSQIFGYK